jgi:flagellar assembly protein FliH
MREAEALLLQARLEAEELIRAAREEAERLRSSAYRQAQEKAREECEAEQLRLRELAGRLGVAYQEFCERQIPALASLASLAAEKLLGETIASEPERVIAIVRQAMEQVVASTQITLRLNPQDVDLVQAEFPANPPGHGPTVRVMPDLAVERGGCWIDSEQGKVDATVAGRRARLEAALGEG